MSRNNVSENFEACYLRENMCKKAFNKSDDVKRIMSQPDFNRCVRHVANSTFKKNRATLLRSGFEYDDILNIVTIIGVQFINNPFEGETPKDTSYILMRFINQKMETFFLFLDRKFRNTERYDDLYLDDIFPPEIFHGEYPDLEYTTEPIAEDDPAPARGVYVGLKSELLSNIPLYAPDLARLATSKHIGHDIRKKAKMICKANNIDYVGWATTLIKAQKLDAADFILDKRDM